MEPGLLVVLILGGVALIQACVWIPLGIAMRKKRARRVAEMNEELASCAARGERVLLGPTMIRVRLGHGSRRAIVALTNQRVVVSSGTRKDRFVREDVALDEVLGVREDDWFNSNYRGGWRYVILQRKEKPDFALHVSTDDAPRWSEAIRKLIDERATTRGQPSDEATRL
jgi:hypothetical protein